MEAETNRIRARYEAHFRTRRGQHFRADMNREILEAQLRSFDYYARDHYQPPSHGPIHWTPLTHRYFPEEKQLLVRTFALALHRLQKTGQVVHNDPVFLELDLLGQLTFQYKCGCCREYLDDCRCETIEETEAREAEEEAEREAEFDPFDGAGTCEHGEDADDCGLCE